VLKGSGSKLFRRFAHLVKAEIQYLFLATYSDQFVQPGTERLLLGNLPHFGDPAR
jgi:hypothetical protein